MMKTDATLREWFDGQSALDASLRAKLRQLPAPVGLKEAILSGNPQPARMVWHKLYASTQRTGQREKAAKDRHQATILAAILVDDQPGALELTWRSAPAAMRKKIVPLRAALLLQLAPHPHARATIAALLR